MKKTIIIISLILCSSMVLAGSLPTQGGNYNNWGTQLNNYIHEELYNVTELSSLLSDINATITGNTTQEMIDAINNTQIYDIKINQSNILNPIVDTNTNNITGYGESGYMCLWNESSNMIKSNIYQDNNNNIIINRETSGTEKLNLYNGNFMINYTSGGSIGSIDGAIYFRSGDSSAGSQLNPGSIRIISEDTYGKYHRMGIYTNNNERISITKNGNIGVGLTEPSHKLSINGSINITGTIDGIITCQEYHPVTGYCMRGFNSTCNIEYSPDGNIAISKCN